MASSSWDSSSHVPEPDSIGTLDSARRTPVGAASEAIARAFLTAGDLTEVAAWKARAAALLDQIEDADDREILEGDIATLP